MNTHTISRDGHAARIASRGHLWAQYGTTHDPLYSTVGASRYVITNSSGVVTSRAISPSGLIVNSGETVRHEDQLEIQQTLTELRRRKLAGMDTLISAGLSFRADITKMLIGFESIGEHKDAEQSMNPTEFDADQTVITKTFIPCPITHKSFSVPWRQTGFEYKTSLGLNESAYQVLKRLETTLFNGNTGIVVPYAGSGKPLYGFTNHPQAGTGSISDWSDSANVAVIHVELIEQIGDMWVEQGGVGSKSVVVFVGKAVWTNLQNDYKANTHKTVQQRMMDVDAVKAIVPIEVIGDTDVVLVEMEARTVQVGIQSDLIAVPHTKTIPMAPSEFTTYAAMVPFIKADTKGNTGVRVLTYTAP